MDIFREKLCELWDKVRDRIMIEINLKFEDVEKYMFLYHDLYPDNFMNNIYLPNNLANEIADFIEEKTK